MTDSLFLLLLSLLPSFLSRLSNEQGEYGLRPLISANCLQHSAPTRKEELRRKERWPAKWRDESRTADACDIPDEDKSWEEKQLQARKGPRLLLKSVKLYH